MRTIVVTFLALVSMQTTRSPQEAVDELLAADRKFASEAAKSTVVPTLTAMFADDVVMIAPGPPPGFARGKKAATEALKTNPDNAAGRLEWTSIRGGIAADGQHGFTVGYMTLERADATKVPGKYVAYWVKKPEGWRVAVYKRARAEQSPNSRAVMSPALPAALVAASPDDAAIARYRSSLADAEKAFSDDAQKIGLGPAFAKHGSADAVNVGPPTSPTFIVSAEEIGRSIGAGLEGKPSPVSWAADEGVIVASSGDLGVTFGYIRPNAPTPGQAAAIPFITIWRRANPNAPWKYVAE